MLALGNQDKNVEVAVEDIKHHVSNAIHDLVAGTQHPPARSTVGEVTERPVTSDQETKELGESPQDSSFASFKLIHEKESLKEL